MKDARSLKRSPVDLLIFFLLWVLVPFPVGAWNLMCRSHSEHGIELRFCWCYRHSEEGCGNSSVYIAYYGDPQRFPQEPASSELLPAAAV